MIASCVETRTKLLILLLSILCVSPLCAQIQSGGAHSARSIALGRSGVAHIGPEGYLENVAAGLWSKDPIAILSAQRLFSLSDVNYLGAGAQIHLDVGAIGIEVNQFGSDQYREQKIGLSYSRLLGKKIGLGIQLNYLQLSIEENGSAGAVSAEINFLSKLTDDVSVGVHLYSPAPVELAEDFEIPSLFTVGAEYRLSPSILVSAEVYKDIDFPVRIRYGLAYTVREIVELRLGGSTEPSQFSFGVGVRAWSGLHIDVASNYDVRLGFSPALGLRYQWQRPAATQ